MRRTIRTWLTSATCLALSAGVIWADPLSRDAASKVLGNLDGQPVIRRPLYRSYSVQPNATSAINNQPTIAAEPQSPVVEAQTPVVEPAPAPVARQTQAVRSYSYQPGMRISPPSRAAVPSYQRADHKIRGDY